jgi:hypothetical protein
VEQRPERPSSPHIAQTPRLLRTSTCKAAAALHFSIFFIYHQKLQRSAPVRFLSSNQLAAAAMDFLF